MTTQTPKTEALISRLARLVESRTITSNQQANKKTMGEIAGELKQLGLHVSTGSQGSFPYCYAHFRSLSDTEIWFYAHLDVVEGHTAQFDLQRRRGRLYGRGTFDMKFAIAVYLQLCVDLAPTSPSIGIIIVSDEEDTGEAGAGYLASKLKLSEKTVIIPDGGTSWGIESSAKGTLWCKLEAHGLAAHASRVDVGINAIETLIKAIPRIKSELHTGDGHAYTDTTVNIGTIRGGQVVNQVPNHAFLELDIRFLPPHTPETIKQQLLGIAQDLDLTLTTSTQIPALRHNLDHPDMKRLQTIMTSHLKREVTLVNSYGATDAQFFAGAGANPIVFSPEGSGHHTSHEYITIRGLTQTYQILHDFIDTMKVKAD